MRIFMCLTCQSLEELPDYDGPMVYDEEYQREVPAQDDLLEYIIAPHRRGEHRGQLVHVDDDDWRDKEKREEILKQIRAGVGYTGMEPEVYALKSTLHEDALKCYNAHRRPKDGCIDYKDRSKRIGNSLLSDEERREGKQAGMKLLRQPTPRFLCEFCPVEAHYVQKKKFDKAGLYD